MTARTLQIATPMLFLLVLISCSQKPAIVLNEAKTVALEQGEKAPWDGWLLTDGALTTLLEEVEACQK
jgi:hypothetical protein